MRCPARPARSPCSFGSLRKSWGCCPLLGASRPGFDGLLPWRAPGTGSGEACWVRGAPGFVQAGGEGSINGGRRGGLGLSGTCARESRAHAWHPAARLPGPGLALDYCTPAHAHALQHSANHVVLCSCLGVLCAATPLCNSQHHLWPAGCRRGRDPPPPSLICTIHTLILIKPPNTDAAGSGGDAGASGSGGDAGGSGPGSGAVRRATFEGGHSAAEGASGT